MRLINANKFRRFAHEQLENDKLYSADDILEMIDEQSTTFDIEEVVKELKKVSYFTKCLGDEVRYVNLAKAIEIVRKGGVKND